MRTCIKCGIPKSLEEFRENKSRSDGYQAYCRPCDKQFQADWYQKNKEKVITKTRIRNMGLRIINRKFIIDYLKQHPCVDCGEKDIIVLQFDHIRNKRWNVSFLLAGSSLDTIKKEIAKCEVRCANCHTRKTAKTYKWYKLNN